MLRLWYASKHRKGAALLTGDVGSGKTAVSRAFMSKVSGNGNEVHSLVNPALSPIELLKAILLKLGSDEDFDSKSVLIERIYHRLIENANRGTSTIIIIDEAHVIENPAVFEELRMLLNMQLEDQFLLTMILLGQPPLIERVLNMRSLDERIGIKYHLHPLDFENTIQYLLFRLEKAGARRQIFTEEALPLAYEYSKGIPLRVNNICDRSLLIGLMRKAEVVDPKIVLDAIEDLE